MQIPTRAGKFVLVRHFSRQTLTKSALGAGVSLLNNVLNRFVSKYLPTVRIQKKHSWGWDQMSYIQRNSQAEAWLSQRRISWHQCQLPVVRVKLYWVNLELKNKMAQCVPILTPSVHCVLWPTRLPQWVLRVPQRFLTPTSGNPVHCIRLSWSGVCWSSWLSTELLQLGVGKYGLPAKTFRESEGTYWEPTRTVHENQIQQNACQ